MRPGAGLFCGLMALAVLLAGCAGPVSRPDSQDPASPEQAQAWQAHQRAVAGLDEWTLQGRISVATEDESWSGKLRWRQRDGQFQIAFNAPMGVGAARLHSDGAGVVMQTANGKTYYAADAESLLYRFIGMRLPVAHLRYWVTGLPDPALVSTPAYDAAGRLAQLQQARWRVRYRDYLRVQQVDLPQKIFIENPQLNVRLVIERWGVPA